HRLPARDNRVMTSSNTEKLSRFRRSNNPPRLLVTCRDLDILESIAECRLMNRHQLQKLFFGPGAGSAARRRLVLLFNHGYLARHHIPMRNAYGALNTIYSLDRGGAQLLARARGWEREGWGLRDAHREVTFLDHHLDTIDVRVALTLVCRERDLELRWTDERELRRRGVIQRMRDRDGQIVAVIPDAYFTIASDAGIDGFALEVDRSTVTERRMRGRFRAYGRWAASGVYRDKLPAASFRVLTAFTDP